MNAERRATAEKDLLYFVADILGYGKPRDPTRPYLFLSCEPGSPHVELCRFIESADQAGVTEALDLEPRGFLKSTIGTIGYTLWQLARDPEQAILLFASTREKAMFFLSEIKDHLENNETLLGLFPALHPHHNGPWQQDKIRIEGRTRPRKEPSVMIVGIEQGKAGGHYDRIICDDLHDEANSGTAEQCGKVISAYQFLRPLLIDQRKGEIRVTGTRWNGADLYGWLIERNDEAARKEKTPPVMVRISKLKKEDGSPAWPGMYDVAEIENLKESMDPEVYYSQYENDPFTESQQIFKRSDIEKAFVTRDETPLGEMTYFSGVDPAYGTNKWADFSAIVTWGVWKSPGAKFGYLLTVVDVFRERVETAALIDAIYHVWETWRPATISIEAHAHESVMQHAMREAAKQRGVIPYRTLNRGGYHSTVKGKQRIRKIEPYLRNGTLRFMRGARGIDILIKELQDYPRGAHDDAADALADFPEISFAVSAPASQRRSFDPDRATTWGEYLEAHGRIGESFDGVQGDVLPGIVVKVP